MPGTSVWPARAAGVYVSIARRCSNDLQLSAGFCNRVLGPAMVCNRVLGSAIECWVRQWSAIECWALQPSAGFGSGLQSSAGLCNRVLASATVCMEILPSADVHRNEQEEHFGARDAMILARIKKSRPASTQRFKSADVNRRSDSNRPT